jgi:hypothetical protein
VRNKEAACVGGFGFYSAAGVLGGFGFCGTASVLGCFALVLIVIVVHGCPLLAGGPAIRDL